MHKITVLILQVDDGSRAEQTEEKIQMSDR